MSLYYSTDSHISTKSTSVQWKNAQSARRQVRPWLPTNFNCISLKHTLHQCALQTLDHMIIIQQTDHEEMSNSQVSFCFENKSMWQSNQHHSFFFNEIKGCPTSSLSYWFIKRLYKCFVFVCWKMWAWHYSADCFVSQCNSGL